MTLISSRNNPKIKFARALRQRSARQESGLFLVEGIRPVGEAIQAGATFDAIFYAPDLLTSEFALDLIQTQAQAGVTCYPTTPEVFAALADKENPQGLLALVRQQARSLAELNPQNFPWGVALVEPQDPGNLGTILRTVDAVGASGLFLLDSSVDLYHPNAVRASMGALFWLPVVSARFADFVTWSRGYGYRIYGASAHAPADYRDVAAYAWPRILLLGSEREGLSDQQMQICDETIRLPMRGRSTSLNLGVAAGVLLYAMLER
ncbi:MAG: hypothetical protein A2W35_02430 [Chloroflexi bacterium RBG_16_57_11]|nr:MAG: hypothetical protein A2W35_02430 [Chloroflexi bacterium RBG_16_57_11]